MGVLEANQSAKVHTYLGHTPVASQGPGEPKQSLQPTASRQSDRTAYLVGKNEVGAWPGPTRTGRGQGEPVSAFCGTGLPSSLGVTSTLLEIAAIN